MHSLIQDFIVSNSRIIHVLKSLGPFSQEGKGFIKISNNSCTIDEIIIPVHI